MCSKTRSKLSHMQRAYFTDHNIKSCASYAGSMYDFAIFSHVVSNLTKYIGSYGENWKTLNISVRTWKNGLISIFPEVRLSRMDCIMNRHIYYLKLRILNR